MNDPYNNLGPGKPQGFHRPQGNPPGFNPYAAPQAHVADMGWGGHHGHAPLAGRLTRFAARFIDGIIYMIVAIPMVWGMMSDENYYEEVGGFPAFEGDFMMGTLGTLAFAAVVLMINLNLLATEGQTMGKKVAGVRIVRTDGSPAGLGRLILARTMLPQFLSNIPLVGGIFGLVNVLAIFGSERRCIHDHFADTIVVEA